MASSTMFFTSSSFATLAVTNMALPPVSRILRAVSSPASVVMSVTTMLAPSLANSSAAACPIPLAEPVMMATLSFNLIKLLAPLKFSYQVEIPERHTFTQQLFAPYYVAGNAITNVISKLAGQRSRHFARGIMQRRCRRTPSCALFTCVNSHHRQCKFFFVSDDLWPWIIWEGRRVDTTIAIGA